VSLPRPCLDCGRPSPRSRCAACRARRQPHAGTGSTARGYDRQWRKVREYVLIRDGHVCHWCGAPANTADHVVPLIDGGARLDPANVVAACRSCNGARTANPRRST
jgi:5-methylcytosine-specific restriction endonuclease McrA